MLILKYDADYTVFDTTIVKREEFNTLNDLLAFAKKDYEVLQGNAVIIDTEATNEYSKTQKLSKFISKPIIL